MDGDQPGSPLDQIAGGFQAAQNCAGHHRAPLVVALKVGRTVRAHAAALGFGNIVQKCCPAQHPRAAGILAAQVQLFHRHGRVLPHIVAMPAAGLGAADAGLHFGHRTGQDLAVLGQRRPRVGGAEQTVDLGINALGAHALQRIPRLQGRGSGGFVQSKAQPGREAQRPQDAQSILGKALGRVAHTADHARRQVIPPAVQINNTLARSVGHGVDGKIPPGQVPGQVVHELHRIGMAVVVVVAVQAVGSHLVGFAVEHHRHRAVLFAGQNQLMVGKQAAHFLRPGRGTDVPVPGGAAQQAVTHAAAHHIGSVPGTLQRLQQADDIPRQIDAVPVHGAVPPFPGLVVY